MAGKEGTATNVRKKSRPLRYFYLNGNLHKKLHINRATDTIIAWCYPEHRRVAYTYSDVRRQKEPAFTTIQVGKMLNRSRVTIERAMLNGNIEKPQRTYGLNERKNGYAFYWCEKDVLAAHEYFSTVHIGRPRADGIVTPAPMPTVRELRAMMRDEEIFYVKHGDTFVPTWRA